MTKISTIIKEAIQNGPEHKIILQGRFDPGWEKMNIENEFEKRTRTPHLHDIQKSDFSIVDIKSTDHLSRGIIPEIYAAAPDMEGFNQTYINMNGTLQTFHEHYIGPNLFKLNTLFNDFAVNQPSISKIKQRAFVENLKARQGAKQGDLRALPPHTFEFIPSIETKEGRKKGNSLLFSTHIPYGSNTRGDLPLVLALDVKDTALREDLKTPALVTFTPYIRWMNTQDQITDALNNQEPNKFIMIQGKITNKDQISKHIIDFKYDNTYDL